MLQRIKQGLRRAIRRWPLLNDILLDAQSIVRGPAFPASSLALSDVRKHLTLAVEYICSSEVEGDLAEFGTMSGVTSQIMARALSLQRDLVGRPRRLHLFDSFKGLPDIESNVDLHSQHVRSGVWFPGSCKILDRDELVRRVARYHPKQSIQVHDGWFSKTVPLLPADTRFAMIHIDCDLYQSTLDALSPLFQRGQVAEGAILLFDDWNCSRASPEHGERRAWSELTARYQIHSSDLGSYSWGGHKFLVHSYQSVS